MRSGLCETCRHAKTITSDRGSQFVRCMLSEDDASFPKYPRLPVVNCAGWTPKTPDPKPSGPASQG